MIDYSLSADIKIEFGYNYFREFAYVVFPLAGLPKINIKNSLCPTSASFILFIILNKKK